MRDAGYVSAEIHTSSPESPSRIPPRRCARLHAEPIGLRPSECPTAACRLYRDLSESPPDVLVAPDMSLLSAVHKWPGLVFPARARTTSSFRRPLRLRRAGSSAARSR